jgi:hypothetical protein
MTLNAGQGGSGRFSTGEGGVSHCRHLHWFFFIYPIIYLSCIYY